MALGWQSITANTAVRVAVVLATQATSFAAPAPRVTQFGWYQQLSKAAPVAQAQQGYSVVPFNTRQTNTVRIDKWQQPLSIAVPVAKTVSTQSFVPFNTPQVVTANPQGWRNQSPVAPRIISAVPTQATSFAVPLQSNAVTQFGWFAPLSSPVAVAKAQLGSSFVPFNTPQVVTVPSGWQTIQSSVPSRAVLNGSALTLVVAPFNVPAGWYQQFSGSPPVAKVQLGSSFVPFNTAQSVPVAPPNGWFGQINPAAKSVAAQPTQATSFAVPPQAAGVSTPGQFGWYAPLSKAVAVAQAKQGQSFVPFNTAQAATPSIAVPLVYDAGYPRTAVVYYQSLFSPLPPMAAPSNTVTQLTWQQPLSVAVKLAKAAPQGSSFVPFNTVQPTNSISTFGWFSPLSKPAPVAVPSAGYAFVPLDTAQIVPPPVIIPPPFHGWTPATKTAESWSTISNVNGLWIPAIKTPEGWT